MRAAAHAANPQSSHEPLDGAARHHDPLALHLLPDTRNLLIALGSLACLQSI
jgi:hypothetical protein